MVKGGASDNSNPVSPDTGNKFNSIIGGYNDNFNSINLDCNHISWYSKIGRYNDSF